METEKTPKWLTDLLSGKYKVEDLKFIYAESETTIKETLIVVRRTIERSFYLAAIYTAFFAYWFDKYANDKDIAKIMLIGSAVSIATILFNLKPAVLSLPGAEPKKIIDDYYLGFENEEREKQFYIARIRDNQYSITKNFNTNKRMFWIMALSIIGIGSAMLYYLFAAAV